MANIMDLNETTDYDLLVLPEPHCFCHDLHRLKGLKSLF